jgi:nitrogen regulatory protein P-II 1
MIVKEVKAIIQPFMLNQVLEALTEIPGAPGITISHLQGLGGMPASGHDDLIEPAPRVKLEMVVPDSLVEQVVQTIAARAHTGNSGDGKIFVSAVEEVVKIRTGQRGEGAI